MKVLVACESSGIVRDAFTEKGHDAWSCDLLETQKPGKHYKGDVRDILYDEWDLLIAHPPCTYLSVSGMHWTTRGLRDPQLTEDALEFAKFLMDAPIPKKCIENPVSVISTRIRKPDQIIQPWMFGHDASKSTCLWLYGLEPLKVDKRNVIAPKGWSQVVSAAELNNCENCDEPFCDFHEMHYADCACIGPTEDDVIYKFNKGFLFGTRLKPAPKMLWSNQTPSGQNKLGPSKDRWKIRSNTFEGVAKAMAAQWG